MNGIDIKTINTIGGALFGASLMEDDRDIFGTILGLAIGGATGSLLDVNYSKLHNIVNIEKDFKLVGETPTNDLERLKSEIAELKASDLIDLPSDPSMKFDPNKPLDTVTRENIQEAAKETDDLAILKKLDTFAKNPSEALEELDIADLPVPMKNRTNVYLQGNTDIKTKKAELSRYFRDRGYRGEELETKIAIFGNLLENDQPLKLGANSDKIDIGGHSIKISSSSEMSGVSTYMDIDKVYAVQKLNPFVPYADGKTPGNAIAEAIGITFAEAADREVIGKAIEDSVYNGMKPDDLKALLASSDRLPMKEVNRITEAGYQHQGYETGLRLQGLDRTIIEENSTDLSKVISNTISAGEIFNQKEGIVDVNTPFRNIGTSARTDGGSEFRRFLSNVSDELDLPNLKINMNPDNVTTYTTTMVDDSISILADAARKVNTTASRTNPVSFVRNSTSGTTEAFRTLSEMNLVPRQYATAAATSRLTVDNWEQFNKDLYETTKLENMSLGDGASITNRERLADYGYTMYESSSISSSKSHKVTLTSKVLDSLQKGKTLGLGTLSVPFNSGIHKLVNTNTKLEKAKANLQKSQDVLQPKKQAFLDLITTGLTQRNISIEDLPNRSFTKATYPNSTGGMTPSYSQLSSDVYKQRKGMKKMTANVERQKERVSVLEGVLDSRIKNTYKELDYLESSAYTSPEDSRVYSQMKSVMQGSREEVIDMSTKYKDLANIKYSPNEILGFDANGTTVRVPNTMKSYSLMDVNKRINNNDSITSNFVFKGDSVIGLDDNYLKVFGGSSKLNNILFEAEDFGKAEVLAWGEALGLKGSYEELKTSLTNRAIGREVGSIVRADDAGLTLATDIMNHYQQGTLSEYLNPEDIAKRPGVSQTLVEGILGASERLYEVDKHISGASGSPWELLGSVEASRSSGWSLGMMATSLVEGKATADAVMGMKVLGLRNVNTLLDNIDNVTRLSESGSELTQIQKDKFIGSLNLLEDIFDTEDFKVSSLEPSDIREQVLGRYLDRMQATASSYNNNIETIMTGDIFNKEHLDMYRLAYPVPQESLNIGFHDVSNTKNYGSGSGYHNMSHSFQSHLKRIGYDAEDMALFGKHNAQDIYDMNTITASTKTFKEEDTLNHFFESENKDRAYTKNFMNKIRRMEPEDIDSFLKQQGVYPSIVNQESLYYTMQEEVEGFKTVAIPKHSTSRIGSFETSNQSRVIKDFGKDLLDLVDKDLEYSYDNSDLSKTRLTESATKLKSRMIDIIGNKNNPILKDLFSLEAGNSSYSVVLPATGYLDELYTNEELNKGYSFKGITEERAKIMLRGSGLEVTDENFSDYLSKNRILQTQTTDGALRDYLGIVAREPTLSEFSGSPTKFYVMKSTGAKKLDNNGVYVSNLDRVYSQLMVGDLDLDHALIYNPEVQMTPEQANKLESVMEQHQANRKEILDVTENLSIKGAAGKNKYSLDQSIDYVMDNIKDYADADGSELKPGTPSFRNEVYNHQQRMLQEGNIKAGYRKINTPQLVALSTNLAGAINTIEEVDFRPITETDKGVMRGMNHHLVENLIKMQHEESVLGKKQTSVEKLLADKSEYYQRPTETNRKAYKTSLKENYTNLLSRSSEDIIEKYTPLVDSMIEAELDYAVDPKTLARHVGDIPQNVPQMKDGSIDVAVDTVETIMKNVGLIQTEDMDGTNIARSVRSSYNNITSFAKKTYRDNASTLAIGAGALALGALISQKDPDFEDHRPVRGDIGGMMLEANAQSIKQSQDLPDYTDSPSRSKSGYITPDFNYSDASKVLSNTMRVQGSYNNYSQDVNQSMKKAIFGDNISNVRIDKSYDY